MKTFKDSGTINRPNVYQHHDYREFLKAWLEYLKANHALSLRKLAGKSSIATGYLNMVINGSRNLTDKSLKKLSPHLMLSASEISFFKNLIIIADSDSHKERMAALANCNRFKEYKKSGKNEIEAWKYLSKWHHVAIRELVEIKGFKLDSKWIRKKLNNKVTLKEVNESIEFLKKHGFIKVENGKVINLQKRLNCIDGVYKIALSDFHKSMFSLAIKSIYETPRENREFMGHTVAVNEEDFLKIKKILSQAIEDIVLKTDSNSEKDRLYHFGVLGFPLSDLELRGE